jgi:C1A family cysteine protease
MYGITFSILSLLTITASAESEWSKFSHWVQHFKIIAESEAHLGKMFHNWVDNNAFIQEINDRNLSYSLGHNQFSGMNSEEFREYLARSPILLTDDKRPLNLRQEASFPESVNWVKTGAVTPVKDQGQCGSCWSFSTTGALEGAFFNKYGKLQSFSEQQLVDCDTLRNGGKDHGCNGGLMDNAFSWIQKNGGLCLESEYPYVSGTTQKEGDCKKTCDLVGGSAVEKYVDVDPSSENAFLTALSKTPLSIAIEADQREFQLYKSGVFTGTCGTKLDHGVLAVAYASDYILVKNSWSTSWGDGGYIKLARGSQYNGNDGQCGVFMEPSYPLL